MDLMLLRSTIVWFTCFPWLRCKYLCTISQFICSFPESFPRNEKKSPDKNSEATWTPRSTITRLFIICACWCAHRVLHTVCCTLCAHCTLCTLHTECTKYQIEQNFPKLPENFSFENHDTEYTKFVWQTDVRGCTRACKLWGCIF